MYIVPSAYDVDLLGKAGSSEQVLRCASALAALWPVTSLLRCVQYRGVASGDVGGRPVHTCADPSQADPGPGSVCTSSWPSQEGLWPSMGAARVGVGAALAPGRGEFVRSGQMPASRSPGRAHGVQQGVHA
ncbi:unnamed protein product [Prorocentrum cordatum]|uniref:Uncharacterized protein n=1 Tax=Prorocentrum cordatum TaxID=2364126 RepID=A0ABN9VCM0_9DINO|nr:unnamed protein product [Polarella glacialis]